MGANEESTFILNTKFFDDVADPQMLMAAMQLNEGNLIAKSDMQELARQQGIVKDGRSNEDIDAELAAEMAKIPEEPEIEPELDEEDQESLTSEDESDI